MKAAVAVLAILAAESALLFELPEAGSYELPVIDRVGQHRLLGPAGEPADLLRYEEDACTVVSFVYLSCTDAQGCPLALAQVQRLDRALAARPELAARVRLATVSFDPARDDPAAMARVRGHMAPRADWAFLTAAGPDAIRPVLDEFGQDAVPRLTRDGSDRVLMSHVAKVFLVDGSGAVRNVYASGFLDHRIVMRDLETLLGPSQL